MSERDREAGNKRDAADAGVASPTATSGGSCRGQRGRRGRGKGQPRKRLAFGKEDSTAEGQESEADTPEYVQQLLEFLGSLATKMRISDA